MRIRGTLLLVLVSASVLGCAVGRTAATPSATGVSAADAPRDDCEEAKLLPPDASDESRRITCEVPARFRLAVTGAQWLGHALWLHDLAAWRTTDAGVAARAYDDLDGRSRGWLTWLPAEDRNVEVRYFVEKEGRTYAFFQGELDRATLAAIHPRKLVPPDPADERELAFLRARELALATEELFVCTPNAPNTVVLGMKELDGTEVILVAAMSAWMKKEDAPLGGYHLFRVSRRGGELLSHFKQTQGCIVMDPAQHDGGGLVVTHLTSPTPTLFHVFMSLQYRTPILVATLENGLAWRVDKGRIFLLDDDSELGRSVRRFADKPTEVEVQSQGR